jgi:hypothetical protein
MYKTKQYIIDDYLMHFGGDTWDVLNFEKVESFILAVNALRISLKMTFDDSFIATTFNTGMLELESQGYVACKLKQLSVRQSNVTIH